MKWWGRLLVLPVLAWLAGCSSGGGTTSGTGGTGGGAGEGGTAGTSGTGGASGASGAGGTGGTGGSIGRGGTTGSAGQGGAGGQIRCPSTAPPLCSFTPCGGDLVGTWTIDSVCYAPSGLAWAALLGCNDADPTRAEVTASGGWTFRSDMTFTRSLTTQMTFEFNAPLSCDSRATDCSNLDVPDYAATCTGTGCCACRQVRPASTVNDAGTFAPATAASTIRITPTGGSAIDWQYCVNGNTLTLAYVTSPSIISAHR